MTTRPTAMTLVIENKLDFVRNEIISMADLEGGKCGPENSDLFFSENLGDISRALAICSDCPIKARCLQAAMAGNEQGIWGGTTDGDRAIRRHLDSNIGLSDQEANLVADELTAIMTLNLGTLAQQYSVNVRTIRRWRLEINANAKAMALIGGADK